MNGDGSRTCTLTLQLIPQTVREGSGFKAVVDETVGEVTDVERDEGFIQIELESGRTVGATTDGTLRYTGNGVSVASEPLRDFLRYARSAIAGVAVEVPARKPYSPVLLLKGDDPVGAYIDVEASVDDVLAPSSTQTGTATPR